MKTQLMAEDNQQNGFNKDRAELFEALGHPTRLRILQALSESPLGFSDLKKKAGIDSNGLLSFHLGKLDCLVKSSPEGSYVLTDEGKEAFRIVSAKDFGNPPLRKKRALRPLQIITVAVIVALAFSVYLNFTLQNYNQQQTTALNTMDQNYSSLSQNYHTLSQNYSLLTVNYNDLLSLLESLNITDSLPSNISAVNSSNGLNLTMGMPDMTIKSGQNIDIVIYESNTLNATNTINASSNWSSFITPFYEYYPVGIAPGSSLPVGLAIFKGYYAVSNISNAESLDFIQPGMYSGFALPKVDSYVFQPLSVVASIFTEPPETYVNGTLVSNPPYSISLMKNELITSGYWTDSNPNDYLGQDALFHNFEPGVYTVAGGDEWGQLILLHFMVI
jgi:DNA-binding transcriptional ArsR family regulator